MELSRVVLERAIELNAAGAEWIAATVDGHSLSFDSLAIAKAELLPLRIVIADSVQMGLASTTAIMDHNQQPLKPYEPYAGAPDSMTIADVYSRHAIEYLTDGVKYHCIRLGNSYAAVIKKFAKVQQIDRNTTNAPIIQFQYEPEPYYEFDALLGIARRTYDAFRYILWRAFGDGKSSTPRSLESLLKRKDVLPGAVYERFHSSWKQFGIQLTSYRDCIHHYVPIDFPMAAIELSKLHGQIWTARAKIPDNPLARSKAKFTFGKGLDALSFGWDIAIEIISLSHFLTDQLTEPHADT